MSSAGPRGSSVRRTALEPVAWSVWLLRDRPRASLILVGAFLAAAAITGYVTASVGWAIVAAALLSASMWRWWVPIRYELNSRGFVEQALGRTRGVDWAEIERCEICPDGLLLSRCSAETPLESLRRFYIPWGPRRDEVLSAVAHYLGPLAGPTNAE